MNLLKTLIIGFSSIVLISSCAAYIAYEEEETSENKYYYRYTGIAIEQAGIEEVTLNSLASTTKWEKRKAAGDCLSADPEECFVWCLIEIPEKTQTVMEVTDTFLVKEFVLDSIDIRYIRAED